ncbi:MAG: DMT family transporter [Pseudomonadota bacterium]|jgi:drug/metabolite transporter (DMT)-like permease|uniref:S-adenosylmethionine uptake transporter n=1 Tax=Thalassococcus halodurans TaxID=373675 RepID=A0A1H5Z0A8_9RHOB|nr:MULTISPECIES: DMT family transporter [Thalassococcus]MBO6865865.1 DMT family transporter [Thalassococcus sp.]MEC7670088.1 DMT family transporter [Pseudomonadota bacterium]MEC8579750.1 DMT family transporter [Pseudomonadota bacterium]SEG28876.1 S-adenosylmethionine uptake transporter [Thalassococcus halodurans]
MGQNAKGALLALLSFALYATHDVIVKELGVNYTPFQIVFFSVLFSFPLATVMLIRDPQPGTLRAAHPWWTLTRTAAVVVTGLSAFYAFTVLPLAQTYAILFASPLLITILSIPILGEKVRLRRWMAVIVGLGGVLIVLRPGTTELSLGHLAAMVASVGSALASIIVRKVGSAERAEVLVLYPMLANFVIMGAAMPFVYVPMPVEHLALLLGMALLGFTASIVIILAYRAGEAVIVAPMQYSQILWAIFFGTLLFNETPDLVTLLGAGVIIASGIYIVLREGQQNASENTPVLRSRSRFETGTQLRIGVLRRLLGWQRRP